MSNLLSIIVIMYLSISLYAQDSSGIPKVSTLPEAIPVIPKNLHITEPEVNTPFYFEFDFTNNKSNTEEGLNSHLLKTVFSKRIETTPSRSWRFIVEPAWCIVNDDMQYGFTGSIGLKFKHHMILASYNYCEDDSYYYSSRMGTHTNNWIYHKKDQYRELIGGGFEYSYYLVRLADIFNITVGGTAGFWYYCESGDENYNEEVRDSNSDRYTIENHYNKNDYHKSEYLFGGPQLRIEIGYGIIHAFGKETLLIGSGLLLKHDIGLIMDF